MKPSEKSDQWEDLPRTAVKIVEHEMYDVTLTCLCKQAELDFSEGDETQCPVCGRKYRLVIRFEVSKVEVKA